MALSLALAMVGIAGPRVEEPHPRDYTIQWSAPEACPDEEEIRARVEALLTGPPTGEGTAEVEGTVDAGESGYTLALHIRFRGERDTRELVAPRCDELTDALALVLAVSLQPSLANTGLVPPPPDVETSPALPDPPDAQGGPTEAPAADPIVEAVTAQADVRDPPPPAGPSRPRPDEPPRNPPRAVFRLAPAVELGGLGAVTFATEAAVGVAWERARIEVHGIWLAPRSIRREDGVGGVYQAGAAGARGCWTPGVNELFVPVCGGIEAGALRVASRGLPEDRVRHGAWLGPLVSLGLGRSFGRLAIWGGAELVGRAVGNETTTGGQPLQRQMPVSGRAMVGVEVRLP